MHQQLLRDCDRALQMWVGHGLCAGRSECLDAPWPRFMTAAVGRSLPIDSQPGAVVLTRLWTAFQGLLTSSLRMLRAVLRAGVSCRASRTVTRFAAGHQAHWPRRASSRAGWCHPAATAAAAAAAALFTAWLPALVLQIRRFTPLHTCSLAQRAAAARPGLTGAVPATARPFAGSMAANFRSGSVAAAAEYGNTDVKGASELIQSGASIYADVRWAALHACFGCTPDL